MENYDIIWQYLDRHISGITFVLCHNYGLIDCKNLCGFKKYLNTRGNNSS